VSEDFGNFLSFPYNISAAIQQFLTKLLFSV